MCDGNCFELNMELKCRYEVLGHWCKSLRNLCNLHIQFFDDLLCNPFGISI